MHSGSGRIAALRHEARNDAVKHDTVVKTVVCKFGNAFHMTGRKIRPELDDDIAARGKGKGQAIGLGHDKNSQLKGFKRTEFRNASAVAPE